MTPSPPSSTGQSLAGEVERLNEALAASNRALRRALAEQAKLQAVLVSTVQNLTVGVLAVGQDGIVIVANPVACELLERPLEQLATRNILEVLPHAPAIHQALLTLCGNGASQKQVSWERRRKGRPVQYLELLAVRAQAADRRHLAGVIVIEDQTEWHGLEQQAQLRSRLTGMGEVAVNLAHEIRNPLGSIALFASTLAGELKDDETLGPLAEQIVSGVTSLDHLVAGTLEFTRPRQLTLDRVNLAALSAETLHFVEHPLCEKNVTLTHNLDQVPEAWIAGDAEQLRQVFLNLYLNAIQAVDDGGRITLRLENLGARGWSWTLTDDGCGIVPELQQRIFDPFFTTREKGSGIGLAVVHSILCAHRAVIEVESQPGQGASFRLTFPALEGFA